MKRVVSERNRLPNDINRSVTARYRSSYFPFLLVVPITPPDMEMWARDAKEFGWVMAVRRMVDAHADYPSHSRGVWFRIQIERWYSAGPGMIGLRSGYDEWVAFGNYEGDGKIIRKNVVRAIDVRQSVVYISIHREQPNSDAASRQRPSLKEALMEYVSFASRFGISAQDAYVLPALFERTAQMANLPVRTLLSQATYSNQPLGDYLANAARKVAREDREAA